MSEIDLARDLLARARRVAVLTGAGVSAESGVPTFRGSGGLWNGMSVMQLATPEGFAADPLAVWRFYNDRRNLLPTVKPNPAHFALAALEARIPKFGLITQNVDRLHQAAGSRNVLEIHGNICDVRCLVCERTFDRAGVALPADPRCEACGGRLRPAVVWFGEDLPEGAFELAMSWTSECEVFLVVGTSAVVFPASGLASLAASSGAKVIEVNPEPASDAAHIRLTGKAGELLPLVV